MLYQLRKNSARLPNNIVYQNLIFFNTFLRRRNELQTPHKVDKVLISFKLDMHLNILACSSVGLSSSGDDSLEDIVYKFGKELKVVK